MKMSNATSFLLPMDGLTLNTQNNPGAASAKTASEESDTTGFRMEANLLEKRSLMTMC